MLKKIMETIIVKELFKNIIHKLSDLIETNIEQIDAGKFKHFLGTSELFVEILPVKGQDNQFKVRLNITGTEIGEVSFTYRVGDSYKYIPEIRHFMATDCPTIAGQCMSIWVEQNDYRLHDMPIKYSGMAHILDMGIFGECIFEAGLTQQVPLLENSKNVTKLRNEFAYLLLGSLSRYMVPWVNSAVSELVKGTPHVRIAFYEVDRDTMLDIYVQSRVKSQAQLYMRLPGDADYTVFTLANDNETRVDQIHTIAETLKIFNINETEVLSKLRMAYGHTYFDGGEFENLEGPMDTKLVLKSNIFPMGPNVTYTFNYEQLRTFV